MDAPLTPPSPELVGHFFDELFLESDWKASYRQHAANFRTYGEQLADEHDTAAILDLTVRCNEALTGMLGACALNMLKDGMLAERAVFEQQFGA